MKLLDWTSWMELHRRLEHARGRASARARRTAQLTPVANARSEDGGLHRSQRSLAGARRGGRGAGIDAARERDRAVSVLRVQAATVRTCRRSARTSRRPRPSPTRTPTSSSIDGLSGPDRELRLRRALPLQGSRERRPGRPSRSAPAGRPSMAAHAHASTSTPTAPHSVTLLATQTDARAPSAEDRRLRAGIRSPEAALHDGDRLRDTSLRASRRSLRLRSIRRRRTSRLRSGTSPNVIGRAGFEGVQNDDEGQPLPRRGRRRGQRQRRANARTKQPNSFFYRFKPKRPREPAGRRDAPGASGDRRREPAQGFTQPASSSRRGRPPPRRTLTSPAPTRRGYVALHQYGTTLPTKWIDISTTTLVNAVSPAPTTTRSPRPRARPRSSGPRTSRSAPLAASGRSASTRPATPTTAPAPAAARAESQPARVHDAERHGRLHDGLQADPVAERATRARFRCSTAATRRTAGFDNVAFLSQDQIAFVEDAGDTLHAPAQRARLRATVLGRRPGLLARCPAGSLPRRGPRRGGDDRLGPLGLGGFQNDGDNEITGLYVSDGDTEQAAGCSARSSPKLLEGRTARGARSGRSSTAEHLRADRSPAGTTRGVATRRVATTDFCKPWSCCSGANVAPEQHESFCDADRGRWRCDRAGELSGRGSQAAQVVALARRGSSTGRCSVQPRRVGSLVTATSRAPRFSRR